MLTAAISAVTAFVATNVDDIFMLMLFFAREERDGYRKYIFLGQYLGMGVLILVSLLGGAVLGLLPDGYLGLLGLIPMALGIREWCVCYRQRKTGVDTGAEETEVRADRDSPLPSALKGIIRPEVLGVALVTIANGGDNIGVYTPLFAGASVLEAAVTILVFLILVAVWCLLGQRLAALPVVSRGIRRYKGVLVPVVLVGLGMYILLGSLLG